MEVREIVHVPLAQLAWFYNIALLEKMKAFHLYQVKRTRKHDDVF